MGPNKVAVSSITSQNFTDVSVSIAFIIYYRRLIHVSSLYYTSIDFSKSHADVELAYSVLQVSLFGPCIGEV